MNEALLAQIENSIRRLSAREQLWLMERLARHIRESTLDKSPAEEDQLVEMAADPDIQREIQRIDEEFSCTEADGLGVN